MREIKFREWETERKTMVAGEREDYDDSVGFRFAHEEGGRRILMQYVGIKDKHKNDIYEGDIVRCFNDGLSVVVFKKGCFGLLTHGEKGTDYYTFDEIYGYCEILGNIHENPELLEG